MINAAELRIGNIIKSIAYFEGGNATTDIVVHWDLIRQIITETQIFEYKPIELTEDWLIRGGFDKYDNWITLKLDWGKFFIDTNQPNVLMIDKGWHEEIWLDIPKYVHRLQNLVFALSGTELTFTE